MNLTLIPLEDGIREVYVVTEGEKGSLSDIQLHN